jgi:hypothetical protein
MVTFRSSFITKSLLPSQQRRFILKATPSKSKQCHRQRPCSRLHHNHSSDGQISCRHFEHITSSAAG